MTYTLDVVLHMGAEHRIFASTNLATGVNVVLKMPREAQPSASQIERLRHEHAMLGEAQGAGVVGLVELWAHGKTLAVVTERWGRVTLGALLDKGPLSLLDVLRCGAAIARVLGRLHRQGILHRDVKPENILVGDDLGDVRIIDFGIAVRRTTYIAEDAAPEHLAGTLAYMAPEQTGRMNRGVDWRADLYSFGATLYRMLTGVSLFDTHDLAELVHAQMAKVPVPPQERAPGQGIPEIIGALVLKLLAKNPEQRYQSADGVAYDLELAARELVETQTIRPFSLATHDFVDRVRQPSRLHGREEQQRALETAYARIAAGAVELVLVAGPSGVGKSALVGCLSQHVRAAKGIFAPGKFDLIQRGTPYYALSQALRSIVRRRLADSADNLARWKTIWQRAAGPNGQILVHLMPEIVHILGTPPPLVEVGPTEAKNRFLLTVQYFLRVTATAEHPLVLFIDDLQWADSASLVLLQKILTDVDTTHLLVVGAYRDNEVDAEHGLHALKEAVRERQRGVHTIDLTPLGLSALEGMVADMLERPSQEIQPLAALLKVKTDGSPFFVEQYLRVLHEQRLLERDFDSGVWRWNAARIDRAHVTDNVASLLPQKLDELSPTAQRVLALGACVGAIFDLALVREVEDISEMALRMAIDELRQQGLVRQAVELVQESMEFVHDRVQQAAYALLRDEEERMNAHHALAHAFDRRLIETGGNAELFAMLYHALRSLARLTNEDEQRHVAERCLRGGQQAKEGSAYADAVKLLRTGKDLLGDAGWHDAFALTFDTHVGLAEAEWLAGQTDVGEGLFRICVDRAPDLLTRSRVSTLWVTLLAISGRFLEALERAFDTLGELGWRFPTRAEEYQPFMAAQLQRILPRLMGASLDDIRAWPSSTDPEAIVVGTALVRTGFAAIMGKPAVFSLLSLAMVEHTLRYGVTRITSTAAGFAGITSVLLLQDLAFARRLIDMGRIHLPKALALTCYSMYVLGVVSQYLEPLGPVIEEWEAAAEIGFREGDVSFGELSTISPGLARIVAGQALMHLPPYRSLYTDFTARQGAAMQSSLLVALTAATPGEAWPNAEEWVRTVRPVPLMIQRAEACAGYLALHLGDDALALRHALRSEPYWIGTGTTSSLILMVFTLCLSAARLPEESAPAKPQVDAQRARLEKWAAFTPQNFLHMKLLVDAWQARNESRFWEAGQLFEAAIADARNHGFLQDEALGLRMIGEYFLERGMPRAASGYLMEARDAYLRWGSPACAQAICDKHSEFFPQVAAKTTGNVGLDVHTAIRAAQALSSELDPDRVVGRLMELCIANAGAQHGALVLIERDMPVVVARMSVENARIETGLTMSLARCRDIAATVVHYVVRSRESLVVNDMANENRFGDDDYLKSQKVRSLLALPLAHRGRLVGVLYLEHRDAPSAFPPARVELLSVLASQAAIAVENAQQVRVLESRNREVQQLNEELRRQIAQRSRSLMQTLLSKDNSTILVSHVAGSLIGDRYRVRRLIGEGGMGAVYEVERTTDGLLLAAKVLNRVPDRSDLGRFAREAEILAKLAHPNLISIFDIDITDDGVFYIIMELVSGTSLGNLTEHAGSIPWRIRVIGQVAKALAALHAMSIVHRDLKPDNILVTVAETDEIPIVKLADFGISIILDDVATTERMDAMAVTTSSPQRPRATANRGSGFTQTGVLVGTPYYMAPELGYGSKNAQPTSDIFSWGVIAFELFTGQKPFAFLPVLGGSVAEDAGTTLRECPGLSCQVAEIIERSLNMDPAQRPRADELVAVLEREIATMTA